MPASVTAGNQSISVSVQDILSDAALKIGVLSQGEAQTALDSSADLAELQRLIDHFNARTEIIFSHTFQNFTLIANHAPHTIGPGGDFNVSIRPVKILSANFILNPGSPSNAVYSPVIRIRDERWWANNPIPGLLSSIVTDLYYDPAVPLGNLNFWPVCNQSTPVRLEMWNSLSQALNLQTKLVLPQGYWDAIVCELAVRIAPSYEREPSPTLVNLWNRAMRVIEGNNSKAPRIDTDGSGMPTQKGYIRPDFNFLTGLPE